MWVYSCSGRKSRNKRREDSKTRNPRMDKTEFFGFCEHRKGWKIIGVKISPLQREITPYHPFIHYRKARSKRREDTHPFAFGDTRSKMYLDWADRKARWAPSKQRLFPRKVERLHKLRVDITAQFSSSRVIAVEVITTRATLYVMAWWFGQQQIVRSKKISDCEQKGIPDTRSTWIIIYK